MDYDDNDFQSQNFQLGAEDNKFPLPKFDIDEHLQVHLRFDSLVDTDVLLGIHNQDNNWIEDFSSGNSAIDFNPSAAKTHTVSRHTNVWSEATSSESVEMLLKSVGEDEMSNNKAIAMESDLQNVSSNLINPMDPTSKDDNNYIMETFAQDDKSEQPDKVERDLSDHNTYAGQEVKRHPESIGDALVSHDDLSKNDAQKVSLPLVESTVEPLVMVKDNVSEISENCDSFLESIAYQVEVFNKGSKAVEIVGEKHTEMINQNVKELGTIEAATEVNSPSDTNPTTLMKCAEAENSSDCDNSKLEMQTHETEIVVVEKTVEVNIVENAEEFGSKLIPQENAVPKIPFERLHNTAEDVASSVSTDATNMKSDASLVDKAEVTTAEPEDKHLADVSGFGAPYVQESTNEAKSNLDSPLSENRSSEQKETTPPKSHAYNCVNAGVKEIKITEDVPNVQVPAFENTATADLVLEQNASEVSNQLSSDGMNSNGTETSKSENCNSAQLESNVDNRLLEDPNIRENKLIDASSPTIGIQHSWHVENSDGTQCKFQLQSLPDKPIKQEDSLVIEENIVFETEKDKSDNSEASPDANMQTVYGEIPSHSEENILSTFSPSAVDPLIIQGDFLAVEENVVSEIEKDKSDKSDDVSSQITLGVQHSCHVESSDGTPHEFQHYSLLDKLITEDSLAVEENTVSGKSDNSDASPGANMQTVYGDLSRHSEENILSTFSPSAAKPPITQGDSLMVEENIASEIDKDKSDKSDDASSLITLGAQHSCHVENSDGTLSDLQFQSLSDKPITQEDYAVVEENTISRKEMGKSDNSDTSPNANMQTAYGEFPSHREEIILSTFSPSAVRPPITEGDSLVVEENIVFEIEKDKSNKSDDVQHPCHDESSDGTRCKFQLQSLPEKSITQKDSPVVEENTDSCHVENSDGTMSDLHFQSLSDKPITQEDYVAGEENTISRKETDKSDNSDTSPNANMQTVYGEFPSPREENILSTFSPSAVRPPITKGDSLAVEENIVFEIEKDKSNKSDDVQHPRHVESSDGTQCKFQLQPLPEKSITQKDSPVVEENTDSGKEKDKFDDSVASLDANIQTVYGEFPGHIEGIILSTPSPSALKPPITQVDSPAAEENIVSEKEKDKSDKSDDVSSLTTTGVQHSCQVESSDRTRCKVQLHAVPDKPNIQEDSSAAEDNTVLGKENNKPDNSDASPGAFPSHSEENILSTPSPSAVNSLITQRDSPAAVNIVSEKKDKSDKSDDESPIITMGAQHSCHVESSDETRCKFQPQSLPDKPVSQKDSPAAEENIISEKEKDKSVNSAASLDVNMQTVYDGFPGHSEENIMTTPSPSALKPPITQADSSVVEETVVSEKAEDKSDKSETSPNSNIQILSGELGSHSKENILSTPSPPYVKPSETHLMAVETGKTSAEPSCGSSTIINICIPSHDNSGGDKIDAIKPTDPDSKKSIAIEDDKSFSFEVRKAPDTGNQWKPFPDVLSSDSPKTPKETTMAAIEKKSTKSRAKSTKVTATRKMTSESAGIPYITPPSASVGTVSSGFQLEEVKVKAESSRKRKTVSPIIQTSSLPDLNSSVSASTLLHQPFSDIQQVQLRAQIFVYGSLIQGIPPDEACMQSAFGEKDGGRSIWETTWRKSVDRYQTQKSPANQETPILPHSAVRTPSQEIKSGSFQSKVSGTSAGKYVGKSIAPAIASTPLPMQSPVWNIPSNFPRAMQLDFDQASSPLHPYPSPQTKQFTNNTTPWVPSNHRPAQWAISAQSPALKSATQYSSVLAVDTVKVTPIRESSMPHTSMIPSPMPVSVPLESQGNTATPQKSRKRKKALVSEDISNTVVVSQSTPAPLVSKSLPTIFPFAPLTIDATAKVATEPVIETAPHISPPTANSCQISTGNDAQIAKFSEEMGNKIEQAKQYAEEAAAVAASVVSHGQGIWNQIAAQKKSSVPIDTETKLASVAAAATAAASVAKAAASAAKIAFEAVVQAKVMADEAINSAKTEAVFDAGKNLAMLTPGSILKGKDKMHGSSMIISAASDAARKRVEEASAASKRAENLNAIMKAAELAAEAVSHVGIIIAMGDPLPFKLSELVEAGPEGCWKSFSKVNKLKDLEQSEKTSVSNQVTRQTVLKDGEQPFQSEENCDGLGERTGKSSTLQTNSHEKDLSSVEENTFRKGSLVEVISDEDGLKGGWFSARVLDVEDNRVHVCYNNLLSDDGPEQLKEWVSLDSESNGAPRIRIAHPRIVTKNEGTKKRRREAANNYVWEVGDHVDAWMRDGWWEGIITEKNQLDETKLTVHFPAGGDSSLVRAWDLRTSLSWKDGQWTEWSREKDSSTLEPREGDTPQEKRRRLGKIETDGKGANTLSKEHSLDIPEIAEASRSLKLSKKDTIFSLGKKEDDKSDTPKGKRADPHKEGSGAVFVVPKGPAKKQKFMDVSKHYGSDKADKSNQGKDPLKFPKYLMPQASRAWRNTSKNDPRGKRAVDSKPTTVLKSARPLNSNVRNVKRKDSSNTSVTSASNDENPDKNYMEDSVSSRPLSTESVVAVHSASKKKPSSVNEGDRGVKRRFTPSGSSFRSEKNSGSEKETSDANEPRRSSRKIQPTSRLLEGLQSSMMMSRIPSFTHNKSSKTPHRSSSSRGNIR